MSYRERTTLTTSLLTTIDRGGLSCLEPRDVYQQ